MDQKNKSKHSVKITEAKTTKSVASRRVDQKIKNEIKNENSNKKIIIVSLIIALLLAIIAYVQISNKDDNKEDNKEKKEDVVEKQDDIEEKDDDGYEYSYTKPTKAVSAVVDAVVAKAGKTVGNDTSNADAEEEEDSTEAEDIYYAITFVTNSSETIDKQILTQDETTTSVLPTKDGWSFAGWYIDENFSEEFIFGGKLSSDITLYAKWVKFVKYIVDGEELDILNTATVGEAIPLPTTEELNNQDDSFEYSFYASKTDEFDNVIEFEVNDKYVLAESDFDGQDTIVLNSIKRAKFDISFYESEDSVEPIYVERKVVEGKKVNFANANNAVIEKGLSEVEEFGWYYVDGEGNKYNFAYGSIADKNITKLYLSDVYVVIYNEEEQDEDEVTYKEIDRQNVSKDTKINDILDPADIIGDREFDGWYVIDDNTNEVTDEKLTSDTVVSSDLNVVLKCVEEPEVQQPTSEPPKEEAPVDNEEEKETTEPKEEQPEESEDIEQQEQPNNEDTNNNEE